MTDCKPVGTPIEVQLTHADLDSEKFDSTLYRRCIGSLMYLAVGSHPDIAFAVSRLAQFVESPTVSLWNSAKRVLRYLSGAKTYGILYHSKTSLPPYGYSDSDWGGCKINRKSTSRYVFSMEGEAVSWKSKSKDVLPTLLLKRNTWRSRQL
eukprot:IDg15344t1